MTHALERSGACVLPLSEVTMPAHLVCLRCKERIAKDEPYILDMYARAWCETCVIEYLGQYEPPRREESWFTPRVR